MSDEAYIVGAMGAELIEAATARAEKAETELATLRAEADAFHMNYRMTCDVETKQLHVELATLRALAQELLDTWLDQAAMRIDPDNDLVVRAHAVLAPTEPTP